MKKIILYIVAFMAVVSCVPSFEYEQTLGLLHEYNLLSENGGSTQVAVVSNTNWTVEMDRPCDWASIDRLSGEKCGYLTFDFDVNYGRSRRVILVFRSGDQVRTLNMYQKSPLADDDCIMDLDASSINAPAEGLVQEIKFETNIACHIPEMFLTITYPQGQEPEQPWITLKSIDEDKVSLEIAPNTTGAQRNANVRLTHVDAGLIDATEGDPVYSNTISVVQTF